MSIDFKLKWVLDNAPFSRVEMAKRLGVSRQAIYHWEYGFTPVNLSTYNLILAAAGLTADLVPENPESLYPEWYNHKTKQTRVMRCLSTRMHQYMKPGEIRWIPEHYKQIKGGPIKMVPAYYHIKDFNGKIHISLTEKDANDKLKKLKAEYEAMVARFDDCDLI